MFHRAMWGLAVLLSLGGLAGSAVNAQEASGLERERKSLENELGRFRIRESDLAAQKKSLNTEQSQLAAQAQRLKEQAAALKAQDNRLAQEGNEIERLDGQLSQDKAAIEAERGQLRTNADVEYFNRKVRDHNARLERLKEFIEAYNAKIRELVMRFQDHRSGVRDWNRRVEDWERRRDDYNLKVTSLGDDWKNLERKIQVFNQKLRGATVRGAPINLNAPNAGGGSGGEQLFMNEKQPRKQDNARKAKP
ncbi:MAG: hypothetical protein HYS12_28250 [Planctomycetes bacterium]|nr:hypothetical protein [Planctomycetota bacterium]